MLKWILGIFTGSIFLGYVMASNSYTPISKQINLKTGDIKFDYITEEYSLCSGTCRNYSSSSSSRGGGGFGGK